MDQWEELEQQCRACKACALCEGRNSVVFGVGAKDAQIMFVGEGPGEQEDLQGEPFVGPAGKLLDDMLRIIDLERSKVYIANIVKCRPPHNRDPLDAEQDVCIEFLERQIALIDPVIIVCLGRVAAKRLINPDYKITREHGTWIRNGNTYLMATYHPSALLRDPSKRPDAFRDLLSLRSKITELGAYKKWGL